MTDVVRQIADNLAQVRGRIAAAAQRSGRTADSVRLVAITKSMPLDVVSAVVETGCLCLGESRPQDLWAKAESLDGKSIEWHMIGHLQRNKIRRTLPWLALIQSVDSHRLLAALDQEAAALGTQQNVLLEVNVSRDISKTGLPPPELAPLLQKAAALPNIFIRGLMGMASFDGGLAAARRDFARLRGLRDSVAGNFPANVHLAELSMGMSGDFEVAIEEGATMVRVGSALFEGLEL